MSATVTLEAPSELRTAEALIALERVEKVYRMGKVDYRALRGDPLTSASSGSRRTSRK